VATAAEQSDRKDRSGDPKVSGGRTTNRRPELRASKRDFAGPTTILGVRERKMEVFSERAAGEQLAVHTAEEE
jgi:hypothetical protein